MAYSDGGDWQALKGRQPRFELPAKVKVGVFASATAKGRFAATFDNLKFSQHRAKP